MNTQNIKKTALVLGGGGFIGGHLAKHLKEQGFWVRIVDIKSKIEAEYWNYNEICDEYIQGDLRDPRVVSRVMFSPKQHSEDDKENAFDEV
jgi:nucleoside-diphosphate-sugar epimerase